MKKQMMWVVLMVGAGGGMALAQERAVEFAGRVTPLAGPEIMVEDVINALKAVDSDEDGYSDADDNCPGVYNPDQRDADGDGIGDICQSDVDNDSFPDVRDNCPHIHNILQTDTDQDGIGDACDDE